MNRTEKYYKEIFAGFKYETSNVVWQRLKWRLIWLKFKFYILGASAIAITGLIIYFGLSISETNPNLSPEDSYFPSFKYQSHVIHTVSGERGTIDKTWPDDAPMQSINQIQKNQNEQKKITNRKLLLTDNIISADNSELYPENIITGNSIDLENTAIESNITKCKSISILFRDDSDDSPGLIYDRIRDLYIPNNKTSFSLSLYMSPAYNIQNLSADIQYAEHLNYRNKQETSAFSVSAGIGLQFHIKNWYVESGINYLKFSTYRNYNHTFLAYDSLRSYYNVDTTWAWVYDPPDIGEPIPIAIDSVLVPVYNDINEGTNEWNYLEIPLLAGYKFNRGRFSVDLAAGISIGFLLSEEGNVPSLSSENNFTELSKEKDFVNQTQFNYILRLGVSYHITPDWSITAKPFYKQNLNSVFNRTYPVEQHFKSVGINLGLIVDL